MLLLFLMPLYYMISGWDVYIIFDAVFVCVIIKFTVGFSHKYQVAFCNYLDWQSSHTLYYWLCVFTWDIWLVYVYVSQLFDIQTPLSCFPLSLVTFISRLSVQQCLNLSRLDLYTVLRLAILIQPSTERFCNNDKTRFCTHKHTYTRTPKSTQNYAWFST